MKKWGNSSFTCDRKPVGYGKIRTSFRIGNVDKSGCFEVKGGRRRFFPLLIHRESFKTGMEGWDLGRLTQLARIII